MTTSIGGTTQGRRRRRRYVAMLAPAALLAATGTLLAATGNLDPTFGTGGIALAPAVGFAPGMAVQADGAAIVCGARAVGSTDPTGRARSTWWIRRFLSDGSLDAGFGSGGGVSLFGDSDDTANRVAIDAQGRILLTGRTTSFAVSRKTVTTTWRTAVVRLTSAGALDTTFGSGGVTYLVPPGSVNGSADARDSAFVVQPDGRIVVAGRAVYTIDKKGTTVMYAFVARLDANGALDATFGTSGFTVDKRQPIGLVAGLARQSTGHHVLAHRLGGGLSWALTRFLPSGAADTAFPAIATADYVGGIAVDGSDRIVVTGRNTNADGTYDVLVRRYGASGALDAGFGTGGSTLVHVADLGNCWASPAIVPGGTAIVVGANLIRANHGTAATLRLLDDGSLDASYGVGGVSDLVDPFPAGQTNASAVGFAPDGSVLLAGLALDFGNTGWNWMLVRFQPN